MFYKKYYKVVGYTKTVKQTHTKKTRSNP